MYICLRCGEEIDEPITMDCGRPAFGRFICVPCTVVSFWRHAQEDILMADQFCFKHTDRIAHRILPGSLRGVCKECFEEYEREQRGVFTCFYHAERMAVGTLPGTKKHLCRECLNRETVHGSAKTTVATPKPPFRLPPAAPVKRTRIIPGEPIEAAGEHVALVHNAGVELDDPEESDEPDDEELAGIEAGLADVAAGRTRPLEDIHRELEGETKMANEELCPCGRPAHHRGMHRGQKAGAALRTSAVSASTNGHKRMAISCMGGGEIDLTEPYYKAVEQRDRLNKFIESVERLVSLDKEA